MLRRTGFRFFPAARSTGCFRSTPVYFAKTARTSAETESSETAQSADNNVSARAREARLDINKLWTEEKQKPLAKQELKTRVETIIDKFSITPDTPRDADVTRALGEAFERLLQLHVPFNAGTDLPKLNNLLTLAGRNGLPISRQCIQNLFVRCTDFTEAISILHCLRSSNVSMDISTYYTVLYSLQRLEEESWGKKYHESWAKTAKNEDGVTISTDALEFILFGCPNQILPENKPYLGKVMFADVETPVGRHQHQPMAADEASLNWVNMYKGNSNPATS